MCQIKLGKKDFKVQPKNTRLFLGRWWGQGRIPRKNIPLPVCFRIALMSALVTGERQKGVEMTRVYCYCHVRKM